MNANAVPADGPSVTARPLVVSRARTARRIRLDRWASRLVVLGGIVIIASILAILVVIVGEVWPLFRPPWAERLTQETSGAALAPGEALGVDEYREIAYTITGAGTLQFTSLRGTGPQPTIAVPALNGARITAVAHSGTGRHVLGTSDGRIVPLEVRFKVDFKDGRRVLSPEHEFGTPVVLDPEKKRPVIGLAAAVTASGPVVVAEVGPTDLIVNAIVEKKALIGESRREESTQPLAAETDSAVTALRLDARGENLFVGSARGQLVRYDLRDKAGPRRAEAVITGNAPITLLQFLNGDRTLVVGDQAGAVGGA